MTDHETSNGAAADRLPVGDIIREAFALPRTHLRRLLPYYFLVAIAFFFIIFAAYLVEDSDFALVTVLVVLFSLVAIGLVLGRLVVAFHRCFLLGEDGLSDHPWNRIGWRDVRFVLRYVGASLAALLAMLPFVWLFMWLATDSISAPIGGLGMLVGLATALASVLLYWFLFSQLSLVLPATALDDERAGFGWAWEQAAGHRARVFLLVGLIPVLTSLISDLLANVFDHWFVGIVLFLLYLYVVMVEVAILSLVYQRLAGLPATAEHHPDVAGQP